MIRVVQVQASVVLGSICPRGCEVEAVSWLSLPTTLCDIAEAGRAGTMCSCHSRCILLRHLAVQPPPVCLYADATLTAITSLAQAGASNNHALLAS